MKGERVPAKINPAPSQRQIGAAAMSVIPSKAGMVLHCSELALRAKSRLPRCKKEWVKARHTAPTAIGCRSNRRRSLMRRREFIAGFGSLAAWPFVAHASRQRR